MTKYIILAENPKNDTLLKLKYNIQKFQIAYLLLK